MTVIRENFKVNRSALEVGAEPPVCATWRVTCDPGLDDEPCNIGRPVQSVDRQRLAAFLRLMHEVHDT